MAFEIAVRGVRAVPIEELQSLEDREPWYELFGDTGGALLTNTNTGVYVNFAPPEDGEGFIYSINVRCPRFFALEALGTLHRLAGLHGWVVDARANIGQWETAHRAAGANPRGIHVSSDRAQAVWNWNVSLPERRASLAPVSVPKIFFVETGGGVQTMLEWAHGVHRLAVPGVDAVVYRAQDEPDRLLDRDVLFKETAYFRRVVDGIAVIDAPRFSVLQAAIDRASRGPFSAEIVAPDMLIDDHHHPQT